LQCVEQLTVTGKESALNGTSAFKSSHNRPVLLIRTTRRCTSTATTPWLSDSMMALSNTSSVWSA